jgi:MYXO-CTERM domain-containing protein
MYRARLFGGVLLLTALGCFGQQPTDTTRNPNPDTYSRDYNRPVETGRGWGNWGLLGLLGLTGLLGRGRRETIVRDRDEYIAPEQRRRAS